jgi:protein-disulfide isomerase
MHGLTNIKFYIYILAHSVYKVWIIQELKKLALWDKRNFEEKNGECAACLKYSVLIFVEKIYKMQNLEGSGTPVIYIGGTVLKG